MNPLVSVIIPNYNYADYIGDAVNSIAKQDYDNKQVVVVDDCSTDNSVDVIKNILSDVKPLPTQSPAKEIFQGQVDGMVVYVISLEKNGGPGRSRNIGIQSVWNNTDIFGFLDSDDIYQPTKITKSVRKILENPSMVGAVYSDYTCNHIHKDLKIREYKQAFDRNTLMRECIVNNDSLISKHALQACGLYDETMRTCEDYDLWMRISEKFLIVHIPESLVELKITGKGASFVVDQKQWQQNWSMVMNKAKQRANL